MYFSIFSPPPESYSRELDQRILKEEMPYGYTTPPPPYDTQDFDTEARNSKKEYPLKRGKAI